MRTFGIRKVLALAGAGGLIVAAVGAFAVQGDLLDLSDLGNAAGNVGQQQLMVKLNGVGGWTVRATGGKSQPLDCRPDTKVSGEVTCTRTFATGSTVTLTASGTDDYTLLSWGTTCEATAACTVVMDKPKVVSVSTFKAFPVAATIITKVSLGAGRFRDDYAIDLGRVGATATGLVAGLSTTGPMKADLGGNCDKSTFSCTWWFTPGSKVTLTASPNPANTFVAWNLPSGTKTSAFLPCGGTAPTCSFTVDNTRNATAEFAKRK